jgi:hypothetical protein
MATQQIIPGPELPGPKPVPGNPSPLPMQDAIARTKKAMDDAVSTNAAITGLTIHFQVAMQGVNSTREAATEAYKKAGEANNSMHQ